MLSHETYTNKFYTRTLEEIKPSHREIRENTAVRRPSRRLPPFETIRKISKAKFSVYLIYCASLKKYFAMKVFPHKDEKISSYYHTETRFATLNHQNVVKMIANEPHQETLYHEKLIKISYLVMEYAPYGDFYDVVAVRKLLTDEKLIRTYFKQLIAGLEYLHLHRVCHLDLKLENLLLGENFTLKIADFDLAYVKGDSRICTRGTKFYRAPELMEQRCTNMESADVYAAGIILFVFKTAGILPHSENQLYKGMNLFEMMQENNKSFWQKHCEIQNKSPVFFTEDFKQLFNAMTRVNPKERATLLDVKKFKWYNGPTYSHEELVQIMSKCY